MVFSHQSLVTQGSQSPATHPCFQSVTDWNGSMGRYPASHRNAPKNNNAISFPPHPFTSQEKPPVSRPGAWPCISLCSLCFCFFLFSADQVANGAACFASGLAGSLTFTAAFEFDGVLQRRLVDCNDVFGHDVTSLKPRFLALSYHR